MRKSQTTGKRVALKGRFVFSTQEVLQIAREAEEASAQKTLGKRRCKGPTTVEIEMEQENVLEHISGDSEFDCIEVVQHW